ncbi:hypothetical protein HYR99_25355 [Candidatus Poribacteria bacterium]|nr:hypothetical protein [Candidatus Poribacteria bacterium]
MHSTFDVPIGQRQLFLDDVGVADIQNLTRTMHQPAKKGAVIRPDPSIGIFSHQVRTAPLWDPDEHAFKLLVHGRPDDMTVGACSYFESKDGLHWTKPMLRQVEHRGSLDNNFVLVDTGRYQLAPHLFVYDPNDPDPSRRYKGASHFRRQINGQKTESAVGFFVSPDARTWKMLDGPSVRSSDEQNMSFNPVKRLFILTVKLGGTRGGRAVSLSTSRDFEDWTEPELIFEADELDQELGRKNIQARLADDRLQQPADVDPAVYKVDVYNMGVFRYEGLYIGMPAMYHATGPIPNYPNTDGFHLIQLACSRDLKTWQRLGDRQPFIEPSPLGAGAYDLTQLIGPSNAVVRGDALWFYYTALKYRGAATKYIGEYPNGEHIRLPGFDLDTGAINLAVLRRDGFISLDAGNQQGAILTEPFSLTGEALFVNVDALNGELRVEVLDTDGTVLAASVPLTGDLPCGPVDWQRGNLADFKGRVVSLRFTLRNASFYSYWMEK